MSSDDKALADVKRDIESLKREMAVKEGERNSIFERIKKDFGVKTLDDAYDKLKELGTDIEIKKERREELIRQAQAKLAGYKK
jgi:hypothetical protein